MNSPKAAVFIHAFHLDVLPQLNPYLENIPFAYDLYINFSRDVKGGLQNSRDISKIINLYQNLKGNNFYYTISQNKGMDPGGFTVSANHANNLKKRYDYICKIHTKKGIHNNNPFEVTGDQWRKDLLDTLLGTPERVQEIIDIFKSKNEVGMISCADYMCQDMSSNLKNYKKLCKRYRINPKASYPQSKSFAAGTMFWVRGDILNFFKKHTCDLNNFENLQGIPPSDGTMAHAFERFFSAIVRNMKYTLFFLPTKKIRTSKPKVISFYFPQYHQSDLNDILWGKGFTDWSNLKKAQPKFKNQKFLTPHPELGYYDLMNKKTRAHQARLAKEAGVYGFCYHHYWFNGRRALYKPLEKMLEDGEPDLPFCLNWANEPWTKNWDGLEDEVLVPQSYGTVREWDAHFKYLCNFFHHKNYIKINNKPVFLIYRATHIKPFPEMRAWWDTRAKEQGWNGIHIIQCMGNFDNRIFSGVDGVCEFQPNFSNNQGTQGTLSHKKGTYLVFDKEHNYEIITKAKGKQKTQVRPFSSTKVIRDWSYAEKVRKANISYYNGFFPGWDNTPRRSKSEAIIFSNTSREVYKLYLMKQLYNTLLEDNSDESENFLFMNSWNEWGEGCVMEPSAQLENQTLEDTKEVLDDIERYYIEE